MVNFLKPIQQNYFNSGLDRSSLDTSIALLWGNKTTIGQVCSFSKGVEAGTVEDVPGNICDCMQTGFHTL